MGKKLIIIGANFQENALETGDIHYRTGFVINNVWVTNGTHFTSGANYSIVTFQVTPGESYSVETDKLSSAFAFSSAYPARDVPYIDGARIIAYPDDTKSGIVPSGAQYMTIVQYAPDVGNLFPSGVSIGNDIVRVSDYR